jgi:hypothetical protein
MQGFATYLAGKRPLRRPRHGRQDTIKIGPKEVGWKNMDWINLASR